MGARKKNREPDPEFTIENQEHRDIVLNQVFDSNDDRTTAIVGAAVVDDALKYAIRFFVTGDKGTIEKLLRPDNPLGTFSARIQMCFALGIISDVSYRNLECIRQIRNKFAHFLLLPAKVEGDGRQLKLDSVSFKTQQILSWCNALQDIKDWNRFSDPQPPKEKFKETCVVFALAITEQLYKRDDSDIKLKPLI